MPARDILRAAHRLRPMLAVGLIQGILVPRARIGSFVGVDLCRGLLGGLRD
jgi:hypothetical protein